MPLDLSSYNGANYGPDYTAAITSLSAPVAGTFTVMPSDFTGSFADYATGFSGSDVANTQIGVIGNDIISYTFTYGDSSTGPTLGGAVIGMATDGSLLVDQITGFVADPGAANGYLGTLSGNHYEIFDNTTDLSGYQGNEGLNPALPLTFTQIPEPSSVAIILVGLAFLMVSRIRRRWSF
jgi:hypothetical protein